MRVLQDGQLALDALPLRWRVGLEEEVLLAVLAAVAVLHWGWHFGLVVLYRLDLHSQLLECAGELVLRARVFCPVFVLGLHLDGHELFDFAGQVLHLLPRGLQGLGKLLVLFGKLEILLF